VKKFLSSVLVLSLLCGLFSGCAQRSVDNGLSPPSNAATLTEDYVLVPTTRGDIIKAIKGTSTFHSLNAATAYFTISGTIATVNVTWGTEVKAGDVLITLVEAADYKVELAKAKQALDIAEVQLNQAKEAADGGGEVALAQLKWQQAENNYETAGSNDEQLLLTAEIFKATYENVAMQAKNTYSDLQLAYQISQDEYDIAQANYDACFLKAPISGEITWIDRTVSAGASVTAYAQMMTMENQSGLVHVYTGSSSDAQYLSEGDVITVIDKSTDTQYQGRILLTPDLLPDDINYSFGGNSESYVYMIELFGFDYSEAGIGDPGGDLQIILQDHKNVVLIDSYLLKTYTDSDGQTAYYVNIYVDGVPIRKPITIGIKNGDKSEVTFGLDEGTEVIYTAS